MARSVSVAPGGAAWQGIAPGGTPSAPLSVSSITTDAAAIVSFYAPADPGDSAVTGYQVTPYAGATPLTPTTVAIGSLTSMTDSYGGTALKTTVTGLTNDTEYTFTVAATNGEGTGDESTASGANTPRAGQVFGDEFNGPAGAPDPEWWVYDRCGYLAQSEVQWYKPSHCVQDGSGRLQITAEYVDTSGPRYPSDPAYPGTITQPWRSGACQGNSMLFTPTAGNTMVFESRFQVNANAGNGYWPGFFWLEGQDYIESWKTDPLQEGWDSTGKAEIDVAEWYGTGAPGNYGNVSWAGTNEVTNHTGIANLDSQMNTFRCEWKPGSHVRFLRNGAQTAYHTGQVPDSGAQFFLLIYMQMLAGGPTNTESAYVEYVRVYDLDLG